MCHRFIIMYVQLYIIKYLNLYVLINNLIVIIVYTISYKFKMFEFIYT